jgi:transposase-like protein
VPKPKNSDTEVVASSEHDRRQRRRFSAELKERVLREADACTGRASLGELLRREGIYSSHLSVWRAQREQQVRDGLEAKRPGPKASKDSKDRLIAELEKRNAKLESVRPRPFTPSAGFIWMSSSSIAAAKLPRTRLAACLIERSPDKHAKPITELIATMDDGDDRCASD